MSASILERHFARIGARIEVSQRATPNRGTTFAIDVAQGKKGSFLDVVLSDDEQQHVEVVDVQPKRRHLLLMVRDKTGNRSEKHKFLCGHDERDWFVAAVPDVWGVSNVLTAMEALKPKEVQDEQAVKGVKQKRRNRRRNEAFLRQGEWFFLPRPNLEVDRSRVLQNEPLTRNQGKPHVAEFLYRKSDSVEEYVYASPEYPQGLTEDAHSRLLWEKPHKRFLPGRWIRRDSEVYVRGAVRHKDHKTIYLGCWHLVRANRENEASANQYVEFLD